MALEETEAEELLIWPSCELVRFLAVVLNCCVLVEWMELWSIANEEKCLCISLN